MKLKIKIAVIVAIVCAMLPGVALAATLADGQTKQDVNVNIYGPLFGRVYQEYPTTDSFDYR